MRAACAPGASSQAAAASCTSASFQPQWRAEADYAAVNLVRVHVCIFLMHTAVHSGPDLPEEGAHVAAGHQPHVDGAVQPQPTRTSKGSCSASEFYRRQNILLNNDWAAKYSTCSSPMLKHFPPHVPHKRARDKRDMLLTAAHGRNIQQVTWLECQPSGRIAAARRDGLASVGQALTARPVSSRNCPAWRWS